MRLPIALALCAALLVAPAAADPAAPPTVPASALADGPSGLRYADLVDGVGPAAKPGDRLRVRIRVWAPDGSPLVIMGPDATPAEVALGAGQLLPGFDLGIVGMKAGGERYLTVPAALAYGENPPPGVPANGVVAAIALVEIAASAPARDPGIAGTRDRRPPDRPPEVPAWTTLRSGLAYADLVVGDGPQVAYDRPLMVDYTGWTADELVRFDSSYARSGPFRVTLGARSSDKVIAGWEVALRDMRVGGRRVVRIPAYLAYGSYAQGSIPAHADLIFELHVVSMD
jgi:peptidylprolyl isomerase